MIDPEQLLHQPALQRPSADLDERIAALASRAAITSRNSHQRRFSAVVILACSAIAMCIGFLAGRFTKTTVSDVKPVPPSPPVGSEYTATEVDARARSVEVHGTTPVHQLPGEPPRIAFPESRPLAALSDASTGSTSPQAPPHFWVAPDSLPIDLATFEYY